VVGGTIHQVLLKKLQKFTLEPQDGEAPKVRIKIPLGALFILTISLSLLVDAQSGQGQAIAPYSIVLNAPIVEVKAGSELKVRIVLTNLTDKELILDVDNGSRGEFDYTIRLLDKNGQEPPETRYLRAVRGEDTFDPVSKTELIIVGSNGFRAIKPRETLTHTMDLNKLYVLKPGKYTLHLEGFGATANRLSNRTPLQCQ